MNVDAIRDALISHALSLGLFQNVSGFEPKVAQPTGLSGALWLAGIGPAQRRSSLVDTTVRLEFSFRVGTNMLTEPQGDTDGLILVATCALMQAYSGDFELGGEICNIDLLGAYGPPMAAQAGYLNQDSVLSRVMVITIPMIVNDLFHQAP